MQGVFVVTVDALPSPGSEEFELYGGATINVFTTSKSEAEALSTASREVSEAGWVLTVVDGVHWVTRNDYDEDDTGLEYFEQALIDGVVMVLHTYPPELQDGDVAH